MAKIKIEGILDHLSFQLQAAMKDAAKELKLAGVTERDLFKSFQKAARMRCQDWEIVPEHLVQSD